MIGFYIWLKLKQVFRGPVNIWKLLIILSVILSAVFYGTLFGLFSKEVYSGELENIEYLDLIRYVLMGMLLLSLIRIVLPSYRPLQRIVPDYYPISTFNKLSLSFVIDILSKFYLFLFIFALSAVFFIPALKLVFIISAFSMILTGIAVRRIIQTLIEYQNPQISGILGVAALALIFAFFIFTERILNLGHWLIPLLVLPILAIAFGIESSAQEKRIKYDTQKSSVNNVYLQILWNNEKVRIPLLVGIAMKLVILSVDLYLWLKNGEHIMKGQGIYWLFGTPTFLFTYVFNNTWGFFKPLWLNFELRSGNYKRLISHIAKLLVLPVSIDMLITFPVLFYTWDSPIMILSIYFTSLISLTLGSFFWSLWSPKKIRKTFQTGGSSSTGSNITAIFIVLSLSLLDLNPLFYLLVPFYLFLGLAGAMISRQEYPKRKYKLMKVLGKK
jgi:hypothetical protein